MKFTAGRGVRSGSSGWLVVAVALCSVAALARCADPVRTDGGSDAAPEASADAPDVVPVDATTIDAPTDVVDAGADAIDVGIDAAEASMGVDVIEAGPDATEAGFDVRAEDAAPDTTVPDAPPDVGPDASFDVVEEAPSMDVRDVVTSDVQSDVRPDAQPDSAPTCLGLQRYCGGVCMDVSSNPSHCGACDVACPSACVRGACTVTASGGVERVSVSSAGAQATGASRAGPHSLSADGRFVVFSSSAADLVADDNNGASDVFLRDRATRTTVRVSTGPAGVQGNGASLGAAISADGGVVVFASAASNLVAGDTNGVGDVFLRRVATGEVLRVSVGIAGAQPNGESSAPTVSADGRLVTFVSAATNLVAGDTNARRDVFVFDTASGVTTRVSVGPMNAQANNESIADSFSPDGRHVSFYSSATNLTAGDTNGGGDIFVYDRTTNVTTRDSVGPGGRQGIGVSIGSPLSTDGRYLAFVAAGTAFGAGGSTPLANVFVRDRAMDTLEPVVASGAGASGLVLSQPVMSGDAGYVAFGVFGRLLPSVDASDNIDAYGYDRVTRSLRLLSRTPAGTSGDGRLESLGISEDGSVAAFSSSSTNLVAGDTNGAIDVFIVPTR